MSESPKIELPNNGEQNDKEEDIFKISFKNPVPNAIADELLLKITDELLPNLQDINPDISLNPIFNDKKEMIAIDFMEPLSEGFKKEVIPKIRRFLDVILKKRNGTQPRMPGIESFGSDDLTDTLKSFTELLGTYHVRVIYLYIPILICIFSAMFLAWLTKYPAEIDLNASLIDPEEESVIGIILNGLIPVLISAVVITIIWLAIKKYGLKIFKYIMGVMVLFYDWYGFVFFTEIIFYISWDWMVATTPRAYFFEIIYHILHWGTLVYAFYLGRQFFKNKLSEKTKNILVLLFGIFLGSIFGISFPTWSMIAFAAFLSIWDLITVFKGPLGKIANQIQKNRQKYHDLIEEKLERGEIDEEKAYEMGYGTSLQDEEVKNVRVRDYIKDITIEIGSGDLILYSALVAHAFVMTLSWLVTFLTIIGVLLGMVATLYLLFKKKRVLPALPFSMLFGIILFLSTAYGLGYM